MKTTTVILMAMMALVVSAATFTLSKDVDDKVLEIAEQKNVSSEKVKADIIEEYITEKTLSELRATMDAEYVRIVQNKSVDKYQSLIDYMATVETE